jgi:uncharacterized RDD family membrane protein YckC
MQQASQQEQVEYASLGMRFAGVLVDTLVLFGLLILVMTVYVFVLAGQGRIDPNDPAAAQELSRQIAASSTQVDLLFFAALFVYYTILEAIFSASVGKLVFGMRVVMRDGTRATGLAVVIRNLVRIPEAMLLYVPAGVSYLASPQRQRLGDHAARTIVVRRRPARVTAPSGAQPAPPFGPARAVTPADPPAVAPTPGATQAPPVPPPVTAGAAQEHPQAPAAAPPPEASLEQARSRLKTAALATRGAHQAYLHFSERELAAGAADQDGGYSAEYVGAWYTLADAVSELGQARAELERAGTASGQTAEQATASQPDLVHLLAGLAPYFGASGDEQIHAAFLTVARAEATGS